MKKNSKKKILDAALEIFSQKGYKSATVREICKKAGVNIALINYHFSSKRSLYMELVESIMSDVAGKYPVANYIKQEMSSDEKLRGIVTLLVMRAFGSDGIGKTKMRLQLINREIMEPSDAMRMGMMNRIKEVKLAAMSVVREFLPDASEDEIMLAVLSMVSQCFYPVFTMETMRLVGLPNDTMYDNFYELLIEHVYNFTRSGIVAYKGAKV